MDAFTYRDGRLRCGDVPLSDALIDGLGTPAFVYSAQAFADHYDAIAAAFAPASPTICYSVKSSSNLSILQLLGRRGAAFDVVSIGEVERVLAAGIAPERIVFAGVGKTDEELRAALSAGIHHFNVESASELWRLADIAELRGEVASVALRLNPDVDPKTHRYITTGKRENKFGLDLARAGELLRAAREHAGLRLRGLHCHIGSQIQAAEPYAQALDIVLPFFDELRDDGLPLDILNIGGGFGIDYSARRNRDPRAFAEAVLPRLEGRELKLFLEPGRCISGNAGVLLTRVVAIKRSGRRFIIVDAGMNDLLRPSLYEAHHEIWPVASAVDPRDLDEAQRGELADVVGPICESGDFLGLDRRLPEVEVGDVLAVFSAGAYGFAMASNYNTRPRAVEALIEGGEARVIRPRETVAELLAGERGCLRG